jgi:cysteinyl-tRNA synthetase
MQHIQLYNTKTRNLETLKPIHPPKVTLYHCGPTVYNYAHIGNMRAYVFADTLRRMLEWNKLETLQVINITDVGHLASDADEGEDKMEIGAKREGVAIEEIIARYTNAFLADLDILNIKRAHHFPRATHHIGEQIALILNLESKGFTYKTSDGVYFDTAKFPRYGEFARLDIAGLSAGERVDVGEKRNPTDFALWKFHTGEGARAQEWDSPWGRGFPGWHIECSAMAMKYLGATLDIHTGGADHIQIHHTNEIAQSECSTGKPFAHIWMHAAFMNVDNQKMSKSLGNTYRVEELASHGISPLGYRYWLLTSHYRTQANFTFEAVSGAQRAYDRLRKEIASLPTGNNVPNAKALERATEYINNDLNTSRVIALIHDLLIDTTVHSTELRATIGAIDQLLGLKLLEWKEEKVEKSNEVDHLLALRKTARDSKDWATADKLRDELLTKHGIVVKDTAQGQELFKA